MIYFENDIRKEYKDIYSLWREWDNKNFSSTIEKIRPLFKTIVNTIPYDTIIKNVDITKPFEEGYDFSVLMELKLPKNGTLYFDINTNIEGGIEYIYFGNGKELRDLINDEHAGLLLRPGIIESKKGFTYLRTKKDSSSKIAGKIMNDQLFFFRPDDDSGWLQISLNDKPDFVGYINKNEIKKYSDFPSSIRSQVKKIRGGC
jgi:hypothetical protein